MISDLTIHSKVQTEKENMYRFLRDIVAIPSQDGIEGAVIRRIQREMEDCGFDTVKVDEMGNCIGTIGREDADQVLAFDAHIDTVDTGVLEQWSFDPYMGKEDEEYIYGRGSCDQKAGLAAMVYAGKILKEIGIENVRVVMVASTLEEECEGLCWQEIINGEEVHPTAVISTEPTGMKVNLGHRGRVDLSVEVMGKSAHGAMPELGINAVTRMAEIIREITGLSQRLAEDEFLGKGTLNISAIESEAASKCAVPDRCRIMIDRRLTYGETPELAVKEIQELPLVQKYQATVGVEHFYKTAYTGKKFDVLCKFPTWKMSREEPLCRLAGKMVEQVTGKPVEYSAWKFSTNGVAINGIYRIPCIGLGPGNEEQAHSIDEYVSKKQMEQALESYILIALEFYSTISA